MNSLNAALMFGAITAEHGEGQRYIETLLHTTVGVTRRKDPNPKTRSDFVGLGADLLHFLDFVIPVQTLVL